MDRHPTDRGWKATRIGTLLVDDGMLMRCQFTPIMQATPWQGTSKSRMRISLLIVFLSMNNRAHDPTTVRRTPDILSLYLAYSNASSHNIVFSKGKAMLQRESLHGSTNPGEHPSYLKHTCTAPSHTFAHPSYTRLPDKSAKHSRAHF